MWWALLYGHSSRLSFSLSLSLPLHHYLYEQCVAIQLLLLYTQLHHYLYWHKSCLCVTCGEPIDPLLVCVRLRPTRYAINRALCWHAALCGELIIIIIIIIGHKIDKVTYCNLCPTCGFVISPREAHLLKRIDMQKLFCRLFCLTC